MTDTLVKLLNSRGYQPFRIAKTGLMPPEVYTFDRKHLVRWGPVEDFTDASDNSETLISSGQLPDIEHKHTSKKSTSSAVSFLENVLRCIGISSIPKLDLSFYAGKNLIFSFSEVEYKALEPSKLGALLERFKSKHIPTQLVLEGRLHIAYEYLYANKILMQSTDFLNFENVNSGNLGEYIKLGTEGKVEIQNQTTISFSSESRSAAAFAYKSGRVMPRNNGWEFFPTESFLSSESEDQGRNFVPARGVVLEAEEGRASES